MIATFWLCGWPRLGRRARAVWSSIPKTDAVGLQVAPKLFLRQAPETLQVFYRRREMRVRCWALSGCELDIRALVKRCPSSYARIGTLTLSLKPSR